MKEQFYTAEAIIREGKLFRGGTLQGFWKIYLYFVEVQKLREDIPPSLCFPCSALPCNNALSYR